MRKLSLFFLLFSIFLQAQVKPPSDRRSEAVPRVGVPSIDVRARGGQPRIVTLQVAAERAGQLGAGPGRRERSSQSARELLAEMRGGLGLAAEQAGQLRLLRESTGGDGPQRVDFQQTIGNLPVFEGIVKVALSAEGDRAAVTLPAWMPARLNTLLARVSPEEAARASFRMLRVSLPEGASLEQSPVTNADLAFRNPLGDGHDPILVDLLAFPIDDQAARLAWRIHLDAGTGRRAEIVIDAINGRALYCQSIEQQVGSGRVWRIAPNKGDRVVVQFPDSWLAGSQTQTTGNNADTYLDTDGDNLPDTVTDPGIRQGRAFADNQIFDFPAPSSDPSGTDDPRKFRAAAVTNAFYLANVAHDYFYGLGFDEAAGNFQRDNAGKGGLGNDPVRVEVQDRRNSNNARFVWAREGSSPRMEIGLVTRGTAALEDDRDYAYDSQTVIHEYSHGVTSRVIGGGTTAGCLSGTQSAALDEGWADYFASSYANEPTQSAFFTNRPEGIRRRSYEGYPYTFEDLGNDGFQIHRDGEIWAATLWDIRKALGAQTADRLVYAALRQTGCRATYPVARDAILATEDVLNKNANRVRLWEVFARRGLGASASATDGAAGIGTVFNAAFDLPPDLQSGNRNPVLTGQPPAFVAGRQELTYQIRASDPDGNALRYELTQGPTGMTVDAATGLLKWTSGFLGARVKVAITDGQGGRIIHGFNLRVITLLRAGETVPLSVPTAKESAYVAIDVPAQTPVLQVTSRDGTGDVDITLFGPEGELELAEPRSGSFETMSVGNPTAGRWVAELYAFSAFENARITAALPVPRLLKLNDMVAGLGGETSSETFFRLPVPPGSTGLVVTTAGGSGDVDLLIDRDIPPTCQSFDESLSLLRCYYFRLSANFRNNERVQIDSPQPGSWYVNLTSALGYSGVTLTTSLNVRPTMVVDPSPTVTFNATEGAAAPAPRVLKISDPSGSKFDWTATVNPAAPWLKLSADKGSGDSDLTLSVSTAGLTAGTYRTSVTVNAAGMNGAPQTIAVVLNYTRPPAIATNVTTLNFTAPAGQNPPVQILEISNSGGGTLEWSVAAATTSGGNWLSVDQPRGTGNARLQVIARAGTLAPGAYDGTLTVSATGLAPMVVRVRYVVTVAVALDEASLRTSSYRAGWPVSPGDLVTVRGSNLTAACSTEAGSASPCRPFSTYPLPTESGGLRILVNDAAAPLVYVAPDLVQFIVPFEVAGTEARIVASRTGGGVSPSVVRAIEPQAIGIFSVLDGGAGAGRIYHADGSLVSAAAPLVVGETITIQAGGLGAVNPPVANGAAAPAEPLATIVSPVQVYLDGVEGAVEAAYLEPGVAGVYRVKLTVPAGLPRKYPAVQVQSATSQSQEVSAGGPSLASPSAAASTIARGADAPVILRGINLPAAAGVRIGEVTLPAEAGEAEGSLQTLRVTIPASMVPAEAGAELVLRVVDTGSPGEAPSNPVTLRTR